MESEVDKKFTWVIKNFSYRPSMGILSDQFTIGDCKWCLLAYPKGKNKPGYFSLFLAVPEFESLPPGWRRHAQFFITLVNQNSEKSLTYAGKAWFVREAPCHGFQAMLPLTKLLAKDGGFLVNNELKIVAEVIIHKPDVSEKFQEPTQPMKKKTKKLDDDGSAKSNDLLKKASSVKGSFCVDGMKKEKKKLEDDGSTKSNDLLKEASSLKGYIDVNGFLVPPSQVDIVRRLFAKHPDMTLEFYPKNPHLKTGYMSFLLSLIQTVYQSPKELSNADLVEAENALRYMEVSGFKVDWLLRKLETVKEKKKDAQSGETRKQELKKELKDYEKNCSGMEASMKRERTKVFVAKVLFKGQDAKVRAARDPLPCDDDF